MTPYLVGTAVAVVALLAAEARALRPLAAVSKLLASLGFVGAALHAGALASDYGRAVLLALALSLVGDVALLSRSRPAFLSGLSAFLLAHLAFAAAFLVLGTDGRVLGLAAGVLVPFGLVVRRWLRPHVDGPMKLPVTLYVLVILVMVGLAWAATARHGLAAIGIGATAFMVSDLAVARDRFVAPGIVNRLWGLPLYYAAQLVLASTVAGR